MHTVKNYLLPLLLFSIILSSCSDERNFCDLPDETRPVWIEDIITELNGSQAYAYSYILTGTYEGQEVFILENCCPFCSSEYPVYSCDGIQLGTVGNEINRNNVRDEQFYWAPAISQCSIIESGDID